MLQSQILIIEDDPVVARSLQAGLSREGFTVVWKSTGAEGVEYAQKATPHLVLLDIRLTDVALDALQEYLAVRGIEKASDFVFVRNGIPLKKNFLSQRLKAIGKQADVSVSPHRLRHTFATQLLNVGCRVTSIQKLLGHSNLNTTMTYARAFDQTVMLDYFHALDTIEVQPGGAWHDIDKISVPE